MLQKPYTILTPAGRAADVNNDGKLDMVSLWGTLLGKGDGTFQQITPCSAVDYSIGYGSEALADFNGDGKLDFAYFTGSLYKYSGPPTQPQFLNVALGNGDGTFAAPVQYQVWTDTPGNAGQNLRETFVVADFNGDGIPDVLVPNPYSSKAWLFLGKGDGTFRQRLSTLPSGEPVVADFNGDGKPDVAIWKNGPYLSPFRVYFGNGNGTFRAGPASPLPVSAAANPVSPSIATGDFNGDGHTDMVVWASVENHLTPFTLLGNGDGTFSEIRLDVTWTYSLIYSSFVGDFNGDGKLDFSADETTWYGKGDGTFQLRSYTQLANAGVGLIGDLNGDGWLDGYGLIPPGGIFLFDPSIAGPRSDFDGDKKADLALFRPSTDSWYVAPGGNTQNSVTQQWGMPGDVPVDADFDGDHKNDVAVFRPSSGYWYILPSTKPGTIWSFQWGAAGDIPVAADYRGRGKADMAVYRPSTAEWFILFSPDFSSSNGSSIENFPPRTITGAPLDPANIPAPADYDGDGRVDLAIFQPSTGTWYIQPSNRGLDLLYTSGDQHAVPPTVTVQWGVSGDVLVPGDYQNIGKANVAVWRPSTSYWYILKADPLNNSVSGEPGAAVTGSFSQRWGVIGDVPVPRDYDGDGKTDLAVWRPSSGKWYLLSSKSLGVSASTLWGAPGDVPIGRPVGQ
jgi:hypothetical protein